jgi:cytochrome oxidase assembly protein ShyY1
MNAAPRPNLFVMILAVLAVVAGLLMASGLWQLANETEKRACIEAAQARYPAVGVSAFVTRNRADSGPIKLSFERERQRAVAACD